MRPTIHLSAPDHWLNDPIGLIQLDGRYHVFYQHHPDAPAWGRMQWGHASSVDLVHWMHHHPALLPGDDPDAPDHDGVWSGTVAVVDGTPTAFYTGATGDDEAHRQSVCLARSTGDLLDWTKDPSNPVVDGAQRPGRLHQRDPFVFRHGERWIMLLGTGLTQGSMEGDRAGGAVVVLESADTVTWHDRGVLFTRPVGQGPIDTGPMWECPQLVRIGEDWVLIVSIQARGGPDPITVGAVWFRGTVIDDGPGGALRFRLDDPDAMGWVDGGDVLYAPAVMRLDDGRVLSWAWLRDPDPDLAGPGPTTVGALSLPRVLGVTAGVLTSEPAPELDGLAGGPTWRSACVELAVASRQPVPLGDPPPDCRRIRVDVDPAPAAAGIVVAASSDGRVELAVGVVREADGVMLEVVELEAGRAVARRARTAVPPTAGAIRLDVWVDADIVEAFAGGAAIATRLDRHVHADHRLELAALTGRARFSDVLATALGPAATIAPP